MRDEVGEQKAASGRHQATTSADHDPTGRRCGDAHEWVVFSTALKDVCLMVQCVNCGAMGTVDDPSEEEWSEAFHAPSRPYRWDDDARVTDRGRGPLYVLKAVEGQGEPTTCGQPEGTVA
jgi:hypothetical protein